MALYKPCRYPVGMTATRIERTNRRVWAFAIVYSLAVMGVGVWVAFATGEWIGIVAALGLVVFPIGTFGWHTRSNRTADN